MTEESLTEIMEGDSDMSSFEGCNVFLGLLIIRTYIEDGGIKGAEHDIIHSEDAVDLADAGITDVDAKRLCELNWFIDEGALACYC